MTEFENIKAALDKAKAKMSSRMITSGGIINATTDLVLNDGTTIGERLPGGIESLVGQYSITTWGEVVKDS